MRVNILKYSAVAAVVVVAACSTKKNTFLSRNSHALSSKYNILYNGDLALQAGLTDLKTNYNENFWERLPIERMQVSKEAMKPGETRNPNFERAETKATKAIQKHSMNIGGTEKNPQMDEAHLMLGKARYYEQRFIPALEAFNYILYKYPSSDKIYEAKIWREKTNMRLENDAIAVSNLRKLLSEIKFKDQIYADANATLAQAFLNLEEKDSAVARLKRARDFTKDNEEKARYRFILGQLYEEMGQPDSAFAAFQEVIDMNRKAPRQYVIHAHGHQSMQFDFEKGDTITFLKKYTKLLEDRENRPYLDALNHQLGLFYDQQRSPKMAAKYYNASLKNKGQDVYMIASNYRNLADIYFKGAKYAVAGKYYDSTMTHLNERSREFKQIKKKRENLEDVIKYEAIANANDSIINVVAMNDAARIAYYEDYIAKLKKQDEERKRLEEKAARDGGGAETSSAKLDSSDPAVARAQEKAQAARMPRTLASAAGEDNRSAAAPPPRQPRSAGGAGGTTFYFYNPATVAYGKNEFRKIWGERPYKDNWRMLSGKSTTGPNREGSDEIASDDPEKSGKGGNEEKINPKYTVEYYISQLPTQQKEIDSIFKERNFAYYQLGVIYKEKFREYKLATNKLEELLASNPEERLILPSMYHLYKVYEITGNPKAAEMRAKIISQYPDSRYAQILSNVDSEAIAALSPEAAYNELFKRYENRDYHFVLAEVETAIDQYTGDEIVSKFELLKANVIGKLRGLDEYKKALNFVALNYPNSEEGKQAEASLGTDIPKLENLKFSDDAAATGWKVLYRAKEPEEKATKALLTKVNKFMSGRSFEKIFTSFDIYTETDNFLVIHGFSSREAAEGIASILKDHKDYKVQDTPIIISSWNYQIVQMRKNLDEYLAGPVTGKKEQEAAQPQKPAGSEIPAERSQPMRGRAGDPVNEPDRSQPMRGRAGDPDPQPVQNQGVNPVQPERQNVEPRNQQRNPRNPQQTPQGNPSGNPQQSTPTQGNVPNTNPPQPSEVGGPPPAPQIQSGR